VIVMAESAQFLWIVLRDGRSLFASCDGVSREALVHVLSRRDQVVRLESGGSDLVLRVSDIDAYDFFVPPEMVPQQQIGSMISRASEARTIC
jgi:hypothetical protein